MSAHTGIEWTDSTWNPLRGCSRVSEGCRNCYAEKVAYRFSGAGQLYEGLAVKNGHASWTGKVEFVEKHLLDPLKWRPVVLPRAKGVIYEDRRRRIFVNSMSDLFHESVPDEWIDRIFAVMALCPQHDFQCLTKRPKRMLIYATSHGRASRVYDAATLLIGGDFSKMPEQMAHHRSSGSGWWPLPNVWLGVSVENQAAADERIPLLLQTPAKVRFLSCEPLLAPLNLDCGLRVAWQCSGCRQYFSGGLKTTCPKCGKQHYWTGSHVFNPPGRQVGSGIKWVIVGGESGSGARPMHPDWARMLRDQCFSTEVPFFFKQWGEWAPTTDPKVAAARGVPLEGCMSYVGKKAAGALLDGREWREFPKVVHP